MKIAILSSTIDVRNGYGNMTYEYCSELARQGIDFTLFLPRSEEINKAEHPFDIKFILPEYIFRIKTPKIIKYITTRVDLSDYTVVHSLFDFPYCVLAAWWARRYKKSLIVGAQGTYGVVPLTYFPERYLLKWSYSVAKKIIVPSKFTKDSIIKYSGKNYPIEIIHNGVNFQRFQKEVDVSYLRNNFNSNKILLTVGGLKARKGQDLVIQAMVEIVKKHPDAVYVIVGEGEWRSYYEELVEKLGLKKSVFFMGSVSDDDVVKYFNLCDIYVHTPKFVNFNFEGFGMVYLEAGACKKPVVATDAGGVRDAVVDGKTGFVVGDCDVGAITESVCKLLGNPELRKLMGNNGFEHAKEHDWSLIVKKFIENYRLYSK